MRFVLLMSICGFALAGCQMSAEQQALADDAACLKLGAAPGTERAFQCKLAFEVQRRNADDMGSAAGAAIVAQQRQNFLNASIYGNRAR